MPATAANPTGVNSFNGMSDDSVGAAAFERMYEAGALDSPDPRDAAVLQAERAQQKAEREAAAAPATAAEPPEPAEPTKVEAKEPDEPEYANLDDYLQKSGLERESFLTLPVRLGETDLPLSEVLKRAEAAHEVESRTSELTAKQQAFEASQAKQTQALQQQLQMAEQLGQLAYQELLREYQAINWEQLSQTDPGRWAVLNTQFQQRATQIQGQLNQFQQQRQESAQKAMAEEQTKLFKAFPDWKDTDKRNAALDVMAKVGERYGISKERLLGITDSISLRVLYDYGVLAAKEAERAKEADLALKKVRAAPQISSPGTRQMRDPKVSAINEARAGFHKNPKSLDAQLAFASRIAELS